MKSIPANELLQMIFVAELSIGHSIVMLRLKEESFPGESNTARYAEIYVFLLQVKTVTCSIPLSAVKIRIFYLKPTILGR